MPDVEVSHQLVDSCAMLLIKRPADFDVIVTENLFGDILSDEAAVLAGSLGMLPSASLADRQTEHGTFGLYEPIHGSAPDIAGQDLANPIGTILSAAMMMFSSFKRPDVSSAIEAAVSQALDEGWRTRRSRGPTRRQGRPRGRRHHRDDDRGDRRAPGGRPGMTEHDRPVTLYDTTLRDGTQGENITLSLADKLRIARMLDEYGMPYIEGGWPGLQPQGHRILRRRADHALGDRQAGGLRVDAPPLERPRRRPEPARARRRRDARS